jgi:hypothetical protein
MNYPFSVLVGQQMKQALYCDSAFIGGKTSIARAANSRRWRRCFSGFVHDDSCAIGRVVDLSQLETILVARFVGEVLQRISRLRIKFGRVFGVEHLPCPRSSEGFVRRFLGPAFTRGVYAPRLLAKLCVRRIQADAIFLLQLLPNDSLHLFGSPLGWVALAPVFGLGSGCIFLLIAAHCHPKQHQGKNEIFHGVFKAKPRFFRPESMTTRISRKLHYLFSAL